MKYSETYLYYQKMSVFTYRINSLLKKLKLKKGLIFPETNTYYFDFLQAINDCCEFLKIDLNKFSLYYSEHTNWPRILWEKCNGDPDKFNEQITGECGRANICANCICSFALKYSYDAIYGFLENLAKSKETIRVCDYGCANANISFAMLLRNKISFLTMCDIYNESTGYINYRIKKYGVEKRAVWKDVRLITDHNEYDAIICFDVLEHTKNPSEILEKKIYPMLKKGGLLIIQAPWGGNVVSHLDEAIFDFYKNSGRRFLKRHFKEIYHMATIDISGVWVKN